MKHLGNIALTDPRWSAIVKKDIENLMKKDPDWTDALASLFSYPLQAWASKKRNTLHIDSSNILDLLSGESNRFFGFHEYKNASTHISNLLVTEKIVYLSRRAMNDESLSTAEKAVIQAVHYSDLEPPVHTSQYLVKKYYAGAMEKVCQKYCDEFSRLVSAIFSSPDSADIELLLMFHNTAALVELSSILNSSKQQSYSVNLKTASQVLLKCVGAIKTYPFTGEEVFQIMDAAARGKSQRAIARDLGKSLDFVRTRYSTGIKILSAILWGYIPYDMLGD